MNINISMNNMERVSEINSASLYLKVLLNTLCIRHNISIKLTAGKPAFKLAE